MTLTVDSCRTLNQRHSLVGAVCLFMIRDEKILLLRRMNTGYADGSYAPPNGHVEFNESVTDAIIRETMEEVGVIVQREDLVFAHVMSRRSVWESCDNSERLDMFFMTTRWSGDVKNMEPHKHDRLDWFDRHHLPANTVPYVHYALTCFYQGISYSELDWDDVCARCGRGRQS